MSKNTNLSFLTDYITADITNTRIGIHNTSPSYSLDLIGNMRVSGSVYLATTAGSVGIGTTTPTTLDSGGTNLQIKDRSALFQLGAVNSTYLSNNIFYDGSWKRIVSGSGALIRLNDDSNGISFLTTATGAANSAVTFTSAMNIINAGNVGIGGTPTAKLHVFTANNTNSGNAGASFDNQAFVVGTSTSGILMQYDQTNNIGHIGVVTPGVDWRSLVLQSIGGNVLIGTTTNSGYKLQVNGTAYASNFFSATGTQVIQINTWTTFYTLAADQGMYTVSIGLGENVFETWYAYGTIFTAISRAIFLSSSNGTLVSMRVSGMDVQVLLGSGASFARTLNYKVLRS